MPEQLCAAISLMKVGESGLSCSLLVKSVELLEPTLYSLSLSLSMYLDIHLGEKGSLVERRWRLFIYQVGCFLLTERTANVPMTARHE